MKEETRTVVYDEELRIEAYRFEGIIQPFPSHFRQNYVERRFRSLSNGFRSLPAK